MVDFASRVEPVPISHQKKIKILFIRMSYIGDILHATPAAKAIKEAIPHAELYWIVTPSLVDMLKNNPYVDHIILWERDAYEWHSKRLHLPTMWKMWWQLRKQLKPYHFDIAVDVQGRLITGLVLLASGAKRKLGMSGTKELNWLFTKEKSKGTYRHVIERYLQVAGLLGAPTSDTHMVLSLTDEEKEWAQRELSKLDSTKPIVGLVPGTSWPSKEWIPSYWKEVIVQLQNEVNFVYLGGSKEVDMVDSWPRGSRIYNAVGKTSLRQTMALIGACDCIVASDTGSLHIACALNRPVVSLFGPTDPNIWGPLQVPSRVLVDSQFDCLGCRKRRCPKLKGQECVSSDDRQGQPCMLAITPDKVILAIKEFI